MGDVCISTRNMKTGSIVHAEAPTLVWKDHDYVHMREAFLLSRKESQEAVLTLYHPPLDTAGQVLDAIRDRLLQLTQNDKRLSVDVFLKLAFICFANAYSYPLADDFKKRSQELVTSSCLFNDTSQHSALFAIAPRLSILVVQTSWLTQRLEL